MPSLKSDFILDFFVCLTLLNGTDFEMIDVFMTTHTHGGWRGKVSVPLNLLNVI